MILKDPQSGKLEARPRPPPAGSSATPQNWPFCASRGSADLPPQARRIRRGGMPGIELRSVIRTGRHSVASNRLVTNPSSLRIVLPAPVSHSECRAVVVAAGAQAADPRAGDDPSLARVSSTNPAGAVEPGVHRLHPRLGQGRERRTPDRGIAQRRWHAGADLPPPCGGTRRSCSVWLVGGAALRRIDGCGEARHLWATAGFGVDRGGCGATY